MIKFFRKIRRQLLTENRFAKYLLYAIGEIVLVVIGILIALQINNANEIRKSTERTEQLLVTVQKELLLNIKYANEVIDFYRDIDSLIYKVVNKTVTYNDYKSIPRYYYLIGEESKGYIVDGAFNNFIESYEELSIEQDSIVVILKELYGKDKSIVDEYQRQTDELIDDFLKKLKNEKEWYSELLTSFPEYSDEITEYFINDPFYLNDAANFQLIALHNHFLHTLFFRDRAILIYEKISEGLNLKKDTLIAKNIEDYKHYIGTYKEDRPDWAYSINIKVENNELIMYFEKKDSTALGENWNTKIHPESKRHFTDGWMFVQLNFDENDEVSELIRSRGDYRRVYKKVK
jgi:hypothetical protein